MNTIQHKKNKFPQRNGNFSLDDYYNALKYRNLDQRMEYLAWGIIHKIDEVKKSGKSASQKALIKSILAECLEVEKTWNDDKLELYVTSINMPDSLKPAFLPKEKCPRLNTSKPQQKANQRPVSPTKIEKGN